MIRLKRIAKSFLYAFRGLIKTFHEEQNFKIQSVVAIIILALGFYFEISRMEWIFLVLVIGLVLLMEVLNSAVERIVDVLKPRIDTYVKEIKDIMAAAVMLASIMAVIIGLIIFLPYFINY